MIARVLPDLPALGDRPLDYVVPEELRDHVRVGTLVRIPLHGRRAGGWVVGLPEESDVSTDRLKPIAKVSGWGPSADVVELARWAAWRWAGRWSNVMTAASPDVAVPGLPRSARSMPAPVPVALDRSASAAVSGVGSVVRLPPASDPVPFLLAACALGPTLIVTPSVDQARLLGARLRRSGVDIGLHPRDWARGRAGGASMIGARAAVWAPVEALAAIVVLDEHDERLQEERVPCWHARDVAVERARRAGVPCVLVSPCPTLEALALVDGPVRSGAGPIRPLVSVSRSEERAGWPILEIADRTADDPFVGALVGDALARHVRDGKRIVCVLNRLGRASVLACRGCGALTRCERCGAAVHQPEAGVLACPRCETTRPPVCLACGATRLRAVRPGVARLRDELAALAGEPVAEVTATGVADGSPDPSTVRLTVGTSAALAAVRDVDVVAFADLDAELLAPRFRAGEQALALLASGARLLGARRPDRRLLVQTRVPRHAVLDAVLMADPGRLVAGERSTRRGLGFPPYSAVAEVSGPSAPQFVAAFGAPAGVEVAPHGEGRFLLRAADHGTLADALAGTPRPPGRCRVEVDPLRL